MGKFDYIKWVTEHKHGKPLFEQTANQCADIIAQNYGGAGYFWTCCENQYFPNNPNNFNDASCKQYLDYGILTHGLTPTEVANCCDPNWGNTDGDCNDPLWVNMPTPNKNEYCNRCTENGGGNPHNGVFLVNLMTSSPYYVQDANGLSYCKCCDTGGTSIDCENPEAVAQDPTAALKCFVCMEAYPNCEQLSNIPMTAATAQSLGLNLYNSTADCQAQTECGGGDRCSNPVGSYDDPPQSDHNEDWGLGCWFCHPHHGGPGVGCQMVQVPMDQMFAYQGYIAGTTGLYTHAAACEADPITVCGDEVDMVKCMCCDGNDPISMATEMPATQGCAGSYPGYTNCTLHPLSGGTTPKDYCKKPPGEWPNDDGPAFMVKPDIKNTRMEVPSDELGTGRGGGGLDNPYKPGQLQENYKKTPSLVKVIKETLKQIHEERFIPPCKSGIPCRRNNECHQGLDQPGMMTYGTCKNFCCDFGGGMTANDGLRKEGAGSECECEDGTSSIECCGDTQQITDFETGKTKNVQVQTDKSKKQ